jgi:hypothetical protein
MLGNGFLPMFAPGGAAANVWTGATWAVSGGNAYNVPALGSELLTNNGFDTDTAWTKDAGWTIGGGVAAKEAGSANWIRQSVAIVGRYHRLSFDIVSISAGSFRAGIGGYAYGPSLTGIGTGYAADALAVFASFNGVSASSTASGTVDNVSLRPFVTATLFASLSGSSSNEAAAAKIATITTGGLAGVVALLDSASNPQNFLHAYHDGVGVTLDKCVAGIYTNLIPRVTVAFTANAQIEIRRPIGNTFQLWYNGVQRGTDQTVADTSIINNTRYGLFSTHSGGTFGEFSLDGSVIPFNLPGA